MNPNRSSLLPLVLAATVGLPGPAAAEGTPAIHNVLTVVEQHCGIPTTLQWEVHPRRQQVQDSGTLVLGETGYRVDLSVLTEFRDWTLIEHLNDTSRGVDDSYALFSRTGHVPFEAAYVVTRLPETLRQNDLALQQVRALEQENAGSGKVSFIEADTPFGRGLEMVAGDRVGSGCFPTSKFIYASADAHSIGISRFAVNGDDLIEYTLVLTWPDGVGQEEIIERARRRMDTFQRGLTEDAPR